MKRFEACLLDYGNTVVEFDLPQIDRVRARLTEALARKVGPVSLETVTRCLDHVCSLPFQGSPPSYREVTPHQQMEILLRAAYGKDRDFSPAMVEECDDLLQSFFVEAIAIDDESIRLLHGLRERVRVGLVSNYPCGRALRRSLRLTGLDAILDPIVISGEVGYVKPHASVFQAALEQLRVPANKVLFVGDRWDADMVGGKDAGMRTCHHVGFTSDLDLGERYRKYRPDHQIRRLAEIEEILCGSSGARTTEVGAAPFRG